jgi:hypothetical protein
MRQARRTSRQGPPRRAMLDNGGIIASSAVYFHHADTTRIPEMGVDWRIA